MTAEDYKSRTARSYKLILLFAMVSMTMMFAGLTSAYVVSQSRADWVKNYGFMDDRYFLYLGDVDLSKKVINSGGKIYYDRENIICHKQGGISKQVKAKRLFYSLHAKHLYIKKHFSFLGFLMCDFVMLIPGFFSRLIHAILIERRMTALRASS